MGTGQRGADLYERGSGRVATVAVVIPTFNHAHFLADAIASVVAQTRPAKEIIVVDDGSADDPAAVVAEFQGVKLIRQKNHGLAAARNTGFRNCTTDYVIFLDADDRLLSNAIETGLSCIMGVPECAFVYGGHRLTSGDGQAISLDSFHPIVGDAHLALLRENNKIVSIASVLFRRDCLLAENGFDEALQRCEDYDLFLRLAYRHPIAGHPATVTEYRKHEDNMSNNYAAQLETVLRVLDQHERRIVIDPPTGVALRKGRAHVYNLYVAQMLDAAFDRWRKRHETIVLFGALLEAVRHSPASAIRKALGALARRVFRMLPRPIGRWFQQLRGKPDWIQVGSVRFGDFKRLSPISNSFGFDRGTPVDRHYIEDFLSRNASYIRGRVLEVGDNSYTLRFGGDQVDRSDILNIDASNARSTFVGDLAQPEVLPEETFDCIVFTQTLQFIFDFQGALRTLHKALKPGGVLLLTTAGVSKMHDTWPWYWSFAPGAVRRLLQNQFGAGSILVEAHGNVFVATAFLHGVAVEEIDRSYLEATDKNYAVIVAARAVKRRDV
jgi:glycosyltransferase involved in cell wall biosynthesis/SAM-dependent methyltransferase